MSRRRSESSTSSDIETLYNEEEDELNQGEDSVDILVQGYLETTTKIDGFRDQPHEMRALAKQAAYDTLFEQIGKLKNVKEALDKVEYLLKDKFSEEIAEESSVELVEKPFVQPLNDASAECTQKLAEVSPTPSKFEEATSAAASIEEQTNAIEIDLEQLFDIDEEGQTHFNRALLESLCEQAGSLPIAIISTTGKFRGGKTFWNNIVLKGLQNGVASFKTTEYIGGQNGIRFKGGWSRHTAGIMVWPKVFVHKDKNGEDIAVILMDTQGTYDCQTNPAHSAIIFVISLLMSSIKIFNTRSQIDAQDLDALNLFIEYSRMNDKAIGQNFLLMVRDANCSGFEQGNEYLSHIRDASMNAHDVNRLVQGLFRSFEKVQCFMVKRPAEHVINASGVINAGDCGEEFLSGLCDCANDILKNLEPKLVMGVRLTGLTLQEYVKNLVAHLKNADLKGIGTAFSATKELYFERARTAGIEQFNSDYDELVKKNNSRSVVPQKFDDQLKELVTSSINVYNSKTLFGSQEEKERVFAEFKRYLEDRCAERSKSNRDRFRDRQMSEAVDGSYDKYERMMRPNFKDLLQGNHTVELLREKHEKAHRQAMDNFETAVEPFNDEESLVNDKRALLDRMIQSRFANLEEESFVSQINSDLSKKIAELLEFYATELGKSVVQVHKMDQVEEKIGEIKALLEANYNVEKAKFAIQIKEQMPKLDLDLINNIIDNYKEKSVDLFKKCEDTFMSNKRELEGKMNDLRNNPMWMVLQQMQEATERRSQAAAEREIRLEEARLAVQKNQILANLEIEKLRLAAAEKEREKERIDREVEAKIRRAKEETKPSPPSSSPPPPPPPPSSPPPLPTPPPKSGGWFGSWFGRR
ncbi:unnamed protein product, partial [Mesorhabditis belari]|uniref:Guanylate-binding protein N-terminal domain-containing protein n=1 Tax=Mesorhabditis belari TaxID=2138241 RepID=A0AAF3EIZ2_9BILA